MFWNEKAKFYIQGMQFSVVPGITRLAFQEGEVTVGTDQSLLMKVNGNGHDYIHRNGQLNTLDGAFVIDFSWYLLFTHHLDYDRYLFTHAPALPINMPRASY